MKLVPKNFECPEFDRDAHFVCFKPEIHFLCKFGPKKYDV